MTGAALSGEGVAAAVRRELAAVFASPPLGPDAPASFTALWERLREQSLGGKLIRPRLVDLGHRTVRPHSAAPAQGEAGTAVARLGAAFELMHAALIVHDDVIDRDVLRRGRPTLPERYRQEARASGVPEAEAVHLGRSVGVIAGDVLLTEALRLAVACAPELTHVVASVLFDAATAAAAGELEDVLFALHRHTGRHPDEDGILLMERLKTASYSFEAPLRAGALLAGAPEAHAAALAEAGALLGIAYQIVDDVLGTVGDPARTGKAADADLREGKATLITAHGRRDPAVRRALERVAGAEGRDAGLAELTEAVDAARRALVAAGSVAHATEVAADLVRRAVVLLDGLPMGQDERDEFAATCHHILHREA